MNKYYVYLITKQIIVLYASSYSRSSSEVVFYDNKDISFAFFKSKFIAGIEKDITGGEKND